MGEIPVHTVCDNMSMALQFGCVIITRLLVWNVAPLECAEPDDYDVVL